MWWRCQRSGITTWNWYTATLLGMRRFIFGPKSVHNFCAYGGLATGSASGHAVRHLLRLFDVKTTHCDM